MHRWSLFPRIYGFDWPESPLGPTVADDGVPLGGWLQDSLRQVPLLRSRARRDCLAVMGALGFEQEAAETLISATGADLAALLRQVLLVTPADKPLVVTPLTDPSTFQGMPNIGNSCYLDAVVFAMFGALEVFDHLLSTPVSTPASARRLQVTLACCVNILRAGVLVPAAVVHELRDAIFAAGFRPESELLAQHDASELFIFLTDTLRAPSFTLQQFFFHGGVQEGDDEQRVAERVLQVSIPDDLDTSSPITLERLLQEHFSNAIYGLHRRVDTREDVKEVDAWRMMSMMPFYNAGSEAGTSAHEAAPSRLLLPLILKRYSYGSFGPQRLNVRVVVPVEIDFTPFVFMTSPPTNAMYTLRLAAAVCHEGFSVDQGHYTTWANHEGTWLRFDDLAESQRVKPLRALKDLTAIMHSEIATNAYVLLYELVCTPGVHPHTHSDARLAARLQADEFDAADDPTQTDGDPTLASWCTIM